MYCVSCVFRVYLKNKTRPTLSDRSRIQKLFNSQLT
uniref:Uncharacterized protein n=1 Tax=Podoviridae sp. ctIKM86 TaxID=2827729 RepID=A0A8S5SMF8_9CAUD|nr:MAG TPA: hypothetical protein [Podoviridae sp. ctIKM86]